jgi:hypothetical protein
MSEDKKNKDKPKSISVFNSFEAAEEQELLFRINQDPLERMAETVERIKKLYNYKPQKYYRIYFDKV